MIYKPFIHQVHCTNEIINKPEVGAFMDMGLGKTVSTLNALVELYNKRLIRRTLVIAPKKVAENVWTDEIAKWDHLNYLKASKILGTEKERKRALMQPADIYIINRENIVWLVTLYGNNWPFDTVVIDELSSFKNHRSKRFKALRMVRNYMTRVIGLTGTPAPNGLLDLWSEIFLLDKGHRLGTNYGKYRDQYFNPGKRDGYVVFSYVLKKGNALLGDNFYEKEIYNRIGDICFSMKTEDYLKLPEKIDNDILIELPVDVQRQYDLFEKEQVLALRDKEITAINAAGLTNKLLQFANGAIYDEDKVWYTVHEEKMNKLKEVIEFLNEKTLLLFYSFISDRERILTEYPQARTLKTAQDLKDWNDGKIPILVIHAASAGHGLNLQFGGNNVLWFGCPWSLELYLQGIKRVHRIGITSVVNNMRLIIKNTMDEDVIKALRSKDKVQNSIINAVKARIKKYA